MRCLILCCLLPILSIAVPAADESSDEAEYSAYQTRQQAIREAVAKLDALQAEKATLRNTIDDVKDRHRGLTAEQAMQAWRVAVRAITDRDTRMAEYAKLRETEAFISALKARYGTGTIVQTIQALNDAITAAQAAVAAERAK